MNRPIVTPPPQTRVWLLYYAGISATVALLMVAAVVGIATDNAQNKEQDRLLECFDQYANATAESSKVVRMASAAVSEATTREAKQSARWTNLLVQGLAFKGNDSSPAGRRIIFRFAAATVDLKEAQAVLVKAQAELASVRKDNPVPEPPSTFCEVQP